jgi:pimeloyl-ACP methyl ester carboxylesterase
MSGHSQDPTRRDLLEAVGLTATAMAAATASPVGAFAAGPADRQAGSVSARAGRPVLVARQRLDELAAAFHPVFNQGEIIAPFSARDHGARHDVELRRITTTTRVPETGEKVQVSGLLAMPAGLKGALPVVSWQHGTILSFEQVPSNLLRLGEAGYALRDNVDSVETLFNLHRLAGQGFVVIAADYLGKGPYRNGRGEAYAVRQATVQTCRDILDAGLEMMRSVGVSSSALFLNGWSQGGLNTQWLAQELQRRRVKVHAIAAQSPFNDLSNSMRYWCGALKFAGDYPPLPSWISACLIITLGSYREYYRLEDLFRAAIRPEHLAFAESYWKNYTLTEEVLRAMPPPSALLVEGVLDRFTAESSSRFLSQLAANSATFWNYRSPTRLYYGLADEALHPKLVTTALAANGPQVTGVPVQGASHRATFLASLYGSGSVIAGKGTVPDWFRAVLA